MRPTLESLQSQFRQCRELANLFFRRFSENDLICIDGDTTATLTNILALLAAPGAFLPVLEHFFYGRLGGQPLWLRDLISMPEKVLYLCFSMTVLGLVTVIEWDTLLPDRRDYTVLRPLPVSLGVILGGKIAALAGFWAVFTVTINAVSVFGFPSVVVQSSPLSNLFWFIRCHAMAILSANAFVFLAILSVQGLLMNLLGWRQFRRVSPYVQFALIGALLVMFFSMAIAGELHPGKPASMALRLYPPAWFVGLYQNELGWTQASFRELAWQARLALGIVAALSAASFALSYKRHVRRSLEVLDASTTAPGPISRLATAVADRVLLRTPAERAAFHFVRLTLLRSRRHRALLAAWIAGGAALVFQSLAGTMAGGGRTWWHQPQGALLAAPLVLAPFLLVGLRYVFTIPSELRGNWIFRLSVSTDSGDYAGAVRKAAALIGILPLFGLVLAVHLLIWPWPLACAHVLFGLIVALLLMDVLLLGFTKLPFTCSYVPGRANLKSLWALYVLLFVTYVSTFTMLEKMVMAEPSRIVWLVLFALVLKAGLVVYRRRQPPEDLELVFDDRPEPAVMTLDLMEPAA